MSKVLNLNSDEFNKLKDGGNLLMVDFWAPWCGPCRMIAPIIEELAEDFDGKANICKVNTDENGELCAELGIRSIPAILFYKDGEIVDEMTGANSKEAFAKKLNILSSS